MSINQNWLGPAQYSLALRLVNKLVKTGSLKTGKKLFAFFFGIKDEDKSSDLVETFNFKASLESSNRLLPRRDVLIGRYIANVKH